MSFVSNLLSGGISGIANIIDKFTLSKEEKQDFKLEIQNRLMQMEKELKQTYRTELQARQEIIKAELLQGDLFTKRARPTIIYIGLLFIFIIHVIVPVLAFMMGSPPAQMPIIKLPSEFWWAWGTVVSIYGAGRSLEKRGITNKITNLITGSNIK